MWIQNVDNTSYGLTCSKQHYLKFEKNKHLPKQINLHNEDITQRYWMKPNVDKNYSKFETLTL